MPALFTSTSTPPKVDLRLSKAGFSYADLETSVLTNNSLLESAPLNGGGSISRTATFDPSLRNASLVAPPMPLQPPVTTTTLFWNVMLDPHTPTTRRLLPRDRATSPS